MLRTTLGICVLTIAALLSACGASTSTPVPTATSLPTPTSAPTPTSVQSQATASTSLDPCLLVTSQEASALAGVSFGAGVEGGVPGGEKSCVYGAQTTNVFTVNVAQAPDADTAKADKAAFLADLQSNLQQLTSEGLTITQLPDFADGATYAEAHVSAQGITVNGSAIGVLKGTVFFGFSDVIMGGAPAPGSDAVQAEATTVLTRLP